MKILLKIIIVILIIVILILVATLLFLRFWPSVGATPDKAHQREYAKSDLFYDKQFHNENEIQLMAGKQDEASDRRFPSEMIKVETPTFSEHGNKGEITFTWLGHSSSLLQLGDKNVLIDPVLDKYSSPVTFTGVKRYSQCPVTVETLPEIDVLFISHDHYDHLEYQTIKGIDAKTGHYIVPLGVDVILESYGVAKEKITALNWWEDVTIDNVNYTLTPGQHFTGRDPFRRNRTLWGGLYMNDGSHKVYYTGDTGYYDVFERVYEKLGSVDLMIAENGQYDSAWPSVHMLPEQTVQAARDVHADWLVPVHWGTFCLCNHSWDEPVIRSTAEAKAQGQNIATPRIGQTVNYNDIESYNERWWESID